MQHINLSLFSLCLLPQYLHSTLSWSFESVPFSLGAFSFLELSFWLTAFASCLEVWLGAMYLSYAAVASFAWQMSTHFKSYNPDSWSSFLCIYYHGHHNNSIADKVIFQGSKVTRFGKRSKCSDVSVDYWFCLFLRVVIEFISPADDVFFLMQWLARNSSTLLMSAVSSSLWNGRPLWTSRIFLPIQVINMATWTQRWLVLFRNSVTSSYASHAFCYCFHSWERFSQRISLFSEVEKC